MIRYMRYLTVVFLLLFVITSAIGAENGTITIPEVVEVNKQQIRVGDIADLDNIEQQTADTIKNIELGNSPRPGHSRKLSREFVKLKFRNNGIDPDNYQLEISRLFTVERGSNTVNSEEIAVFATNYVEEKVMEIGDNYEINVTRQPRKVEISAADYNLKIGRDVDDPVGNFSLPVIVEVDGSTARRVFVGLEVNVYREVYVAKRDLNRGDSITKDDFELTEKEIDSLHREPLLDWDNEILEEGVLKNTLRQGDILTANLLEKRVLIRRGDTVQALVKVGNVRLSTAVKALDNGKKDDHIQVENTENGERFRARVLDSDQVLVEG